MIETEHGFWFEEGEEIHFTNVQFSLPKGMNLLAFLEFIDAELRGSEQTSKEAQSPNQKVKTE